MAMDLYSQPLLISKPFTVIVTGWRFWPRSKAYLVHNELTEVRNYLVAHDQQMIVREGQCPYDGVDQYAYEWVLTQNNNLVKPHRCPAQWERYGSAAGPVRNQEMVDLGADLCLGFPQTREPGAKTSGTHNCLKAARKAGIPIRQFSYEEVLSATT